MSEIAPCLGCQNRAVGCHSSCPKYAAFARWIRDKHKSEQEARERCWQASGKVNFDPAFERRKKGKRKRGK